MPKDIYSCAIVATTTTKDKDRRKAVVATSSPPLDRIEQLKIFTKDTLALTLEISIAKILSDRLLSEWSLVVDALSSWY